MSQKLLQTFAKSSKHVSNDTLSRFSPQGEGFEHFRSQKRSLRTKTTPTGDPQTLGIKDLDQLF